MPSTRSWSTVPNTCWPMSLGSRRWGRSGCDGSGMASTGKQTSSLTRTSPSPRATPSPSGRVMPCSTRCRASQTPSFIPIRVRTTAAIPTSRSPTTTADAHELPELACSHPHRQADMRGGLASQPWPGDRGIPQRGDAKTPRPSALSERPRAKEGPVADSRTRTEAQPGTATDDTSIRPFQVNVPDEAIDELRRRIAGTRWPSRELVDDRSQGVQLATVQELARYWTTDYDWRTCEGKL